MKLESGKCCKCGIAIFDGSKPNKLYNELMVDLNNGSVCRIGICPDCFVEETEFPLLMAEIKGTDATRIIKVLKRDSFVEVIRYLQNEMCKVCGKDLGDKWVFTNGHMAHEGC